MLKILDFGDGLTVEEGKVYTDFVGTLYYMSPESLSQLSCTAEELRKSDCWAVGVIAYLIVCGKPPFSGASDKELIESILRSEHKALKFPKGTTRDCRDFISKLLCYDPKTRMSAEEALGHSWLTDASSPTAHLTIADCNRWSSTESVGVSESSCSPKSVSYGFDDTFEMEALNAMDVDDILQAIEDTERVML